MSAAIGMMEGAYFVGRVELLAWLNEFLQLDYKKVEEVSSGAAHVQIMDALYRGKVPLSKVNFQAKLEYEAIKNFGILQGVFEKVGIDKRIEVGNLAKGKFQDNLEFLQWMKKYFDLNYNGEPYDAIGRRAQSKCPAVSDKAKGGGTPAKATPTKSATPAKKITASSISSPQATGVKTIQSGTTAPKQPAPAQPVAKPAPKAAPVPVSAPAKERSVTSPIPDDRDLQIQELSQQIEELKNLAVAVEKERDFYFGKLRSIEIVCQNATSDEAGLSVKIFNILGAAEDDQPLQQDVDNLVEQLEGEILEENLDQVTETFDDLPDDEMY